MKKIGTYEIPFDEKGNQLAYVDSWSIQHHGVNGVKMLPNFEFTDSLTYKSFSRGRSAANFTFERSNGTTVNVFMTDLDEFIPHMVKGVIIGRFTFQKRGQNFGCTLVEVLDTRKKVKEERIDPKKYGECDWDQDHTGGFC